MPKCPKGILNGLSNSGYFVRSWIRHANEIIIEMEARNTTKCIIVSNANKDTTKLITPSVNTATSH
jgi:hypothetical protein